MNRFFSSTHPYKLEMFASAEKNPLLCDLQETGLQLV